MQLVNQEAPILISLNQGAFCDESSSWLLRAADAQQKAGKLMGKRFLWGQRDTIRPISQPRRISPSPPEPLTPPISNQTQSDNLQTS